MARLNRASNLFTGIVLGLFVARLWAEGRAVAISVSQILLVAGALAILGGLLGFALKRLNAEAWPLLALGVYLVWPVVSPGLAWWLAGMAAALLLLVNLPARLHFPIEVPVAVLGLAAYVWTLSPGLLPADSGEFQLVSRVLGIAHPPGYPLYTLLGKLATLLPMGSPAWRVNLLSAIFASASLALVARTVRRATGSVPAALASALALGGITTFWAQATTANIRSLMALFTALMVMLALEYGARPSRKALVALGATAGLAVGHHGSLGLLFLPLAAYLLVADRRLLRRWKWLLQSAGAFAASLVVLLYLPLRSMLGAPAGSVKIDSVSRFLEHVLAQGFRGDMFYFARADVFPGRVGVWLNIVRMEFGVPLALAVAAAALWVLVRKPKPFVLLGGVALVNILTAITYRAPQTVEYLIPSYVALALLLGLGLGEVAAALGRRKALSASLAVAILALSLSPWLANWWSFRWLGQDNSTEQTARSYLDAAPRGATILANWHWTTPLWYLQQVEGARPDVQVTYVYPEGDTPNEAVWIRRIGESLERGPVLVTNWFGAYQETSYRFLRVGDTWQVMSSPLSSAPTGIQDIDQVFGERIRVLGYQLSDTEISPGNQLRLLLYWQPTAPLEGNYSFFVHLVNAQGQVLGQSDLTYSGERFQVGEVVADEHRLSLLPSAAEDDYTLLIGTYIPLADGWQRLQTPDGLDAVPIATVQVRPASAPAVTQHPMVQRFVGGLTLLGVDWDAAGSQTLYLHWRNERLPAGDLSLSLFREEALVVQDVVHVPEGPAFFTSAHEVPCGEGWLALDLHDVAGAPLLPLGPWGRVWETRTMLPRFSASERYVNLGGEILFVGLDARPPEELEPGETLRASLKFLALKPIVHDYSVSLALSGEGGAWFAQQDSTPALGAIPTLKWTRGVVVDDPHAVQVPPEAAGLGALQVTVYDAFTLDPLPVLDAELARLGQGQHLMVGQVTVK